ncbi:MAG TPA: DUF4185 domain-containing protein [Dehalococcoidia bacterium]
MTNARAVRMHQLLIAFVLLIAAGGCDGGGGTPATASNPNNRPDDAAPVIVSARIVCRLIADNAGARAATITGADGSQSVVAGGRGYWFFGDTVRSGPGGRADIIPAAVATTDDTDGSNCIDLEFKATGGIVQPLFPRADETTAWPDGVLALDDGSILFYMVKAYRQSPFAWNVGAVGLGRVPPGSLSGVRVSEKIWDENSGFGARVGGVRSPLLAGDDVIAYLRTDAGANYVARAPLDRIEQAGAYTYWTGEAWSREPSDAAPIWVDAPSTLPADNGVQVTRDERSGKWMAIYNGHLSSIKARVADEPWGPWSEPVTWIDCRTFVEDVYPYCYSAELHQELTRDHGRTMYATVSSQKPYDVTLIELHRGVAIHEWHGADGALRYAQNSPGDGYEDRGTAFYASDIAAPGLSPMYERTSGDGVSYTGAPPDASARPAFFVHLQPNDGPVPTRPVYRWRRDNTEALSVRDLDGWERGSIAFYVPCADALSENSDCER